MSGGRGRFSGAECSFWAFVFGKNMVPPHPFEQRDICLIRRRFAYLILSMGTRIEW